MVAANASGVPRSSVLRLALGVGALAGGTVGVMVAGSSAWQPWVFLIAPDVALLAGISRGLNPGQLHPRAVKLYNALHMFAGPTALAVVSFWLAPSGWERRSHGRRTCFSTAPSDSGCVTTPGISRDDDPF